MRRKNSIYRYRDAESDTAQTSGLASIVGMCFFLFTDNPFLISSVVGFALNIISSILQIHYARVNHIHGRNWTNFANAVISISISISLAFGFGDISAIGGYLSVGLLSVKYWWYTSRILKNES